MPTITATPVKAYAHCRDARCNGYHQQQVDAVREEASYTYGENGGDGIFTHHVESSRVEYRYAVEADAPCPVCSQPRELTGDPRPTYINESGHDPLGLLGIAPFDASAPPIPLSESDEEMESRLRAEIREEQMRERLRKEMTG